MSKHVLRYSQKQMSERNLPESEEVLPLHPQYPNNSTGSLPLIYLRLPHLQLKDIMAHSLRIHSPSLCFVKQTLFSAKKNQEERIKSLTSKINTNQILQKNFNQELRIEVLNSLKTSLKSSENSEQLYRKKLKNRQPRFQQA